VWRLLGLPFQKVWLHAIAPVLKANGPIALVLVVMLIQPPLMAWSWFLLWAAIFALVWASGTVGIGLQSTERQQLLLYAKHALRPVFGIVAGI